MNSKQRRTYRRALLRECISLGFKVKPYTSIVTLRGLIATAYAGEY